MPRFLLPCALALTTASLLGTAQSNADAIPVEIVQTDNGWELQRGGEPYFVKGGCVVRSSADDPDLPRLLDQIVANGGNSIRLWGTGPGTLGILDAAHERGLTVMVGLWMSQPGGHVDNAGAGFDYTNGAAVQAQVDDLALEVEKYRDHPALLAWGVGNELEHVNEEADSDTTAIILMWRAINLTAQMVKSLDPHHPTISVTADLGEWHLVDNATQLATWCDAIDIWGINAYETLGDLRAKVDAGPWDRPYLIPEYGPQGWWSSPLTSWGGRLEHSTSVKATWYREGWNDSIAGQSDRCLGGYAYIWDDLDPPTNSWFMMFGPNGEPSECVDAMYEVWTGSPPENTAPRVSRINGISSQRLDPGEAFSVTVDAVDAEEDPLTVDWLIGKEIFDEDGVYIWNIVGQCEYVEIDGDLELDAVAPRTPGAYRLTAIVKDPGGRIGLATSPFFVEGDFPEGQPMPFAIDDHFRPTGYMGASYTLRSSWIESPNGSCSGRGFEFQFSGPPSALWTGVAWQYPDNNWGAEPGLEIAAGATSIDFLAWTDTPGTKIDVFCGTEGSDGFQVSLDDLELPLEPTQFSIPLDGIEYEDVAIPFGWIYSQSNGEGGNRSFFFSDLTFNGPPPPPVCDPDLTGDRVVDGKDMGELFVNWLSTTNPECDLNEDGFVDVQDLNVILANWGPCPN